MKTIFCLILMFIAIPWMISTWVTVTQSAWGIVIGAIFGLGLISWAVKTATA
jgi:hypothetical protein